MAEARIVVDSEDVSAVFDVALPCEFGRQRPEESDPPSVIEKGGEGGQTRVVIAANTVRMVSRVQFLASAEETGVRIANSSETFPCVSGTAKTSFRWSLGRRKFLNLRSKFRAADFQSDLE